MDRFRCCLVFLTLLASVAARAAAAAARGPVPVDVSFVRSSCLRTRYPAVCQRDLRPYSAGVRRSPQQLAHVSLIVNLARARAASAFVAGLASSSAAAHGKGAVADCVETMGNTVDRLRMSVGEIKRMGRPGSPGYSWCLSNIQTWVSAALTYQTTCLDGLSQSPGGARRDAKVAIRQRVEHLSQVTSNTLALVNRLGSGK